MTRRHLRRYHSEFDHRYTMLKMNDGECTVLTIHEIEGSRLMYEDARRARPG